MMVMSDKVEQCKYCDSRSIGDDGICMGCGCNAQALFGKPDATSEAGEWKNFRQGVIDCETQFNRIIARRGEYDGDLALKNAIAYLVENVGKLHPAKPAHDPACGANAIIADLKKDTINPITGTPC